MTRWRDEFDHGAAETERFSGEAPGPGPPSDDGAVMEPRDKTTLAAGRRARRNEKVWFNQRRAK